jgi:hypothetical protein
VSSPKIVTKRLSSASCGLLKNRENPTAFRTGRSNRNRRSATAAYETMGATRTPPRTSSRYVWVMGAAHGFVNGKSAGGNGAAYRHDQLNPDRIAKRGFFGRKTRMSLNVGMAQVVPGLPQQLAKTTIVRKGREQELRREGEDGRKADKKARYQKSRWVVGLRVGRGEDGKHEHEGEPAKR